MDSTGKSLDCKANCYFANCLTFRVICFLAFNAVYLERHSEDEFLRVLAELLKVNHRHVGNFFIIGPGGIKVNVNDKVIGNIVNESAYICECTKSKWISYESGSYN